MLTIFNGRLHHKNTWIVISNVTITASITIIILTSVEDIPESRQSLKSRPNTNDESSYDIQSMQTALMLLFLFVLLLL